ncbi:MAG: hypothetical protein OEU32_16910 [Acidimicrobiia bacterium]|nr:hypothetical protein [Acidimicrobiia bacterium]
MLFSRGTTQLETSETIKSSLSAISGTIKALTELIATLVAQLEDQLAAEPPRPVRPDFPGQEEFDKAMASYSKAHQAWEAQVVALQDSIAGAQHELATAVAKLKKLLRSANVPPVGRPTIEDERLLSQCVDQLETGVARLQDLRGSTPADAQRRSAEVSRVLETSTTLALKAHDLAMAAIKNMRA